MGDFHTETYRSNLQREKQPADKSKYNEHTDTPLSKSDDIFIEYETQMPSTACRRSMAVCASPSGVLQRPITRRHCLRQPPRWKAEEDGAGQLLAAQRAVGRLQAELARVEQQRPGELWGSG